MTPTLKADLIEHSVIPEHGLRYALTCRNIEPEESAPEEPASEGSAPENGPGHHTPQAGPAHAEES
jgi:hypothetical protein